MDMAQDMIPWICHITYPRILLGDTEIDYNSNVSVKGLIWSKMATRTAEKCFGQEKEYGKARILLKVQLSEG